MLQSIYINNRLRGVLFGSSIMNERMKKHTKIIHNPLQFNFNKSIGRILRDEQEQRARREQQATCALSLFENDEILLAKNANF